MTEKKKDDDTGLVFVHCKAHPVLVTKINCVIGLLVANLAGMWLLFHYEFKPLYTAKVDHEARLSILEGRIKTLIDIHINNEGRRK